MTPTLSLFVFHRSNFSRAADITAIRAYARAVDSSNVTHEQARIINDRVAESLAYVGKLRKRMERRGFPHRDPLYLATCEACDALQHLFMTTHYLSCESGVGRPERE
jgi:hypothetical protein